MLTTFMATTSLMLLPIMNIKLWVYPTTILLLAMLSSLPLTQYWVLNSISSSSMMDNMSGCLIMLSIWITLLMLLASSKIDNYSLSSSLFLVIITALLLILLLCFSSSNIFMFYVWFEASLAPTMFLILLWGYQPERLQASLYLMIYTVTASLPLLLIVSSTFANSSHLNFTYPWISFPSNFMNIMGSLMLLTAFMVKLPLFFVHLWLPKAHVEAPVAGSMILAAILLKLGGYGMMRTCSLFPKQIMTTTSMYSSVALMGAIICSLICLRQTDMKSLIAYSSVSHMGIMIAGVLTLSKWGMNGALLMMVAHGLVSSSLFCMANITYEMSHTRSTILTSGLLYSVPTMSMMWFLLIAANMAAPPFINLMSEIMLITGVVYKSYIMAILAGTLSFTTAAYSLYLYAVLNHGGQTVLTNAHMSMTLRQHSLVIMHLVPAILLVPLTHIMMMHA